MEKAWRVARITRPTVIDRIDEFITDPETVDYAFIIKQYLRGGLGMKVATSPAWLQTIFKITLNNPELYALEQPAVLGIGTARDMAKLAQLLIDGKLISRVDHRLIGHTGLGGQNLRWDEENRLVIAFLSNGLKGGLGDRARTYVRLVETIYDCLPKAVVNTGCATIDHSRMVSARDSIRTS
ncbi:hypothetical protein TELCIR_01406 [Teladorsagia circumcincta]|uniref:Uncharacterized protein n=1 Tax=Teladorsagia circumcincta TaxID=45464 RepID=A0A2G9V214_TELCI|nr:hypothetical protein TELCIR_01406 [Teladorsagia circumcincta]